MSNRLKEQHFLNSWEIKHDAFGNYVDKNGIREYTIETALTDGQSISSVVPRGSLIHTSHPTGVDQIFKADENHKAQAIIGGGGGDIGGIASTGYYDFLRAPVADEARIFNGITFTWKASASTSVQAQLVTETSDFNNTVLGENLFNMVAKLNASANGAINVATYSTNATGGHKNGDRIITTHDTEGAAGDAYTLDSADDSLATRSAATLTGGTDSKAGFDIFRANVTQASTSAPTFTNQLNEVGIASNAITRTAAGIYPITKVGAFPAAKTFLRSGVLHDAATKVVYWSLVRVSDDVVNLLVKEVTYTAANDVVLANKEISGMTTPIIPIEIIVKH